MNQQLNPGIETVFLMADVALQPIASRLVKEIALYGGDIAQFVSPEVCGAGRGAGRQALAAAATSDRCADSRQSFIAASAPQPILACRT